MCTKQWCTRKPTQRWSGQTRVGKLEWAVERSNCIFAVATWRHNNVWMAIRVGTRWCEGCCFDAAFDGLAHCRSNAWLRVGIRHAQRDFVHRSTATNNANTDTISKPKPNADANASTSTGFGVPRKRPFDCPTFSGHVRGIDRVDVANGIAVDICAGWANHDNQPQQQQQ